MRSFFFKSYKKSNKKSLIVKYHEGVYENDKYGTQQYISDRKISRKWYSQIDN